MLTPEQLGIVEHAFRTFDHKGDGLVPLEELLRVFDASQHPRVREGTKAPSAAQDMIRYQLTQTASLRNGVTLDVFVKLHEKMAIEMEDEHVGDKEKFLTETIEGFWRIGEVLAPTHIRPATPIDVMPSGIYATQHMALVWPNQDKGAGSYALNCIRGVVQPIFARGDLPPELRGFFAYPEELVGHELVEVPTQISMQRWLDFVWAYDEGKYAAVQGIVSARVDRDVLPPFLSELILEHEVVKKFPSIRYIPTSKAVNPMYKRTSEEYGYGVPDEVKRIHHWKWKTYEGEAYGLVYQGRIGKFTKKHIGHGQSQAASGMNI